MIKKRENVDKPPLCVRKRKKVQLLVYRGENNRSHSPRLEEGKAPKGKAAAISKLFPILQGETNTGFRVKKVSLRWGGKKPLYQRKKPTTGEAHPLRGEERS